MIQQAVAETITLQEASPEEMGRSFGGGYEAWSCRVGNNGILYTVEKGR